MKNKILKLALPIMLTACATTQEGPALPPMSEPELEIGHQWYALRDGRKYVQTLIAQTTETRSWRDNEGCTWSSLREGFAPTLAWSKCANSEGGVQSVVREGQAWPLEVGKTWMYKFSGGDLHGNDWNGTRKCEVPSTVRIGTILGEHDTYKVVCTDVWNTRTWYVSPALQNIVHYVRSSPGRWVNTRMYIMTGPNYRGE